MAENINKLFSKIKNNSVIIVTLITGWVGNYLYERWSVAANTDKHLNFVFQFFGELFNNDVRYAVKLTNFPYGLMTSAIVSALILFIARPTWDNFLIKKDHHFKKWWRRFINSIVIFVIVFNMFIGFSRSIFYIAKERAEVNIEILAPYISNHEYRQLRSELFSSKTVHEFAKITDRIGKKVDKY